MLTLPSPLHRLRDQRGFTLMETLVAMLTGIVVTGALFGILEVSLRQTTRISDVSQATKTGRTVMTHILDELHSACLAKDFAPVQEGSEENKLVFVSGYSREAEVPATATTSKEGHFEGVRKDEIEWSPTAEKLTDTSVSAAGVETSGKYSFAGTKTAVRLGEKITSTSTTPIFTYYKYRTEVASGSSEGYSTLTPITLSKGQRLTEAQADEVASVAIAFTTAPSDGQTTLGRSANMTGSATFAFTAPSTESTISGGPCE